MKIVKHRKSVSTEEKMNQQMEKVINLFRLIDARDSSRKDI